jgi:hypothetical protein
LPEDEPAISYCSSSSASISTVKGLLQATQSDILRYVVLECFCGVQKCIRHFMVLIDKPMFFTIVIKNRDLLFSSERESNRQDRTSKM